MPTCASDGGKASASSSPSTLMLTNHLPVGVRFTVAGMADAGERSVHHHLDVPELGEDEFAFLFLASVYVKAVVVLLEGEASVAQARAEAGVTRLLSVPHAPEKVVKGPIHPLEDILQDLRVYLGQFRADLFACGQFSAL